MEDYHCTTVCQGKKYWLRDNGSIPRKCTQSKIEFCHHNSKTKTKTIVRKTFHQKSVFQSETEMLQRCSEIPGIPDLISTNPHDLSIQTTYGGNPITTTTIPIDCHEQITKLCKSLNKIKIQHNDLVPHNILIEDNNISLIDFGRSKLMNTDSAKQKKQQKQDFIHLKNIVCNASFLEKYNKTSIKPKHTSIVSRLHRRRPPISSSSISPVFKQHHFIYLLLVLFFILPSASGGWLFSQNNDDAVSVSDTNDPYLLIQVPRSANAKQIKKSYRKLSLKYHPDRNRNDPSATKIFAKLAVAHDILLDPVRREIFDRAGFSGLERYADDDPTVLKDYVEPDDGSGFLDRMIQKVFSVVFGNTDW